MRRVIICGAAGRDFHNFNVLYRDTPDARVVAFTAAQIPDIENRIYPPELAGEFYPEGIPVYPEEDLARLIIEQRIDEVLFSYSDVPHSHVMHIGSITLSAGASFVLASPMETMLKSKTPVVSVCAVRTGCGKSQTTRAVANALDHLGKQAVIVRHPMPYGNLVAQRVQRFSSHEDFSRQNCTIEEMEEYEPHIEHGRIVYAGIDYAAILRQAEQEADVLVWDGGNNDTPFFDPDLEIVVTDPHRAGHEIAYHPGETNFRRADVIVINKMDSAPRDKIEILESNIREHNPKARVVRANSRLQLDHPELIEGKRVLVLEDGPTLTHGEMDFGAGIVAARNHGAAETVDPRPWTVGSITETFERYPNIGPLLPAMGYGEQQIKDLESTIRRIECDVVIIATPVNLTRIIDIDKPTVRVRYELQEIGELSIEALIRDRLEHPD
jgi:predicted GTPase